MKIRFHLLPKTWLAVAAALSFLIPGTVAAQQPGCSALTGAYAFTGSGNVPAAGAPAPVPLLIVGMMNFDEAGTLTGGQTVNSGGFVFRATFSGTYTVRPDCTGTLTVKFTGSGSSTVDFAVAKGGRAIFAMGVDDNGPGASLSLTFTRVK